MFYKKRKITSNRADYWFSRFIRLRDAYENGYVSCCTCGKTKHWKEMQCGHYMSRGKSATRYNELNSHTQCPTCNGINCGEQGRHGLYIDKTYGPGTAQMLVDLSSVKGQKKPTKLDLKMIAKQYRLKVKEIASQKGISI